MGRVVAAELPLLVLWIIHLGIAVLCGVFIAAVTFRLRVGLAIPAGALCGLLLYGLNFAAVSIVWPELLGNEGAVAFSHIVFGLIVAGAYRGLWRRRQIPDGTAEPAAP